MRRLVDEFRLFQTYPRDMRLLVITNMIYAFVLPIVEIFVNAYIMRNSQEVRMVVAYQLTVFTGIPFTFLLNGFLLRHVPIKRLYSIGMMLSGVSMIVMMSLGSLDTRGVAIAGALMGMSFGLYWANRDFLALSTTNDGNRNYYYGLETFLYTIIALAFPALVGWFIESAGAIPWLGSQRAYYVVTAVVFLLTFAASVVVHRGDFANPPAEKFLFFRYHPLWMRFQVMAVLKGLAQGYIVTAPAMLVMKLLGKEGALGTALSVGALLSAILLYVIGRLAKPHHRILVFATGLALFAAGGLFNAALFNAAGVVAFMLCLVLARPLLDCSYFPIQMWVIDTVSAIEKRNTFAYIFNHEFGLYLGRFIGCGLFLVLAYQVSDTIALRYALLVIGVAQLVSVPVARGILKSRTKPEEVPAPPQPAPAKA